MPDHVFVGIGFGPIQAGLFAYEASRSGNFSRIVLADIDAALVSAVRGNGGRYCVNIAGDEGVRTVCVEGVEILNPGDERDRVCLHEALEEATEIVTALPSVSVYDRGAAAWLADALKSSRARAMLVYAAENNNHAAEILEKSVARYLGDQKPGRPVQYLNTVIGKMSRVVEGEAGIHRWGLVPIASGLNRAFLVEEFNRIVVSRCCLEGFRPGIEVFDEKEDILPFEEAKLYGHNAIHALLGYLASERGYAFMSDACGDKELFALARRAFLEESGRGLMHRHSGLDPLFSEAGFEAFADDLLQRMGNPWLRDSVDRVIRDPERKLGWNDRLIGAIRLALDAGLEPVILAGGVVAALDILAPGKGREAQMQALQDLWVDERMGCADERSQVLEVLRKL